MADFAEWVSEQIHRQGWSEAYFARQGGISASAVNQFVNHQTGPGLPLCRAVSRAFNLPLDDVFRLAGILPAKLIPPELRVNQRGVIYNIDTEERGRRIMAAFNALSVDDQMLIMALIDRLTGVEPRIIGDEAGE